MAEWKFRRRQDGCGACGRAFTEGERYVSALRVGDDEIVREDACAACWRERAQVLAGGIDPAQLFFWFTRQRAGGRRKLQLDLSALQALFHELEPRVEVAARELRFVLCLLLMRKRLLKLERVVRDEQGEAMLVRRPRHKDATRVFVFDFTPERLEELKRELQQAFEGAEEPAPETADELARPDGDGDGADGGEPAPAAGRAASAS